MQPIPQSHPNERQLQVVRLLFFFQFAGIGIFLSFINVYLRGTGLSGTQIGVLGMVSALFSLLCATLWGYLSDRTGRPRLILVIGAIGTALVVQLYPLAKTMPAFLAISCLYGIFNSASFTLVDSLALALLGDRREDYGRYRLGGSFGYILTTSISGLIFERVGLAYLFPAFGVTSLFFILTALLLPPRTTRRIARSGGAVLQMIRQPAWLTLVGGVFLVWMAASGAFAFLNITLKDMGASDSLIGFSLSISAICEVPFMAFSGAIIRRFGPSRLFWISMLGYLLRFILYSQMMSPEWAIAINAFSGPVYVLFWNSAINVANRMAPPELSATAQGLLVSATALAGVLSGVLSGWLFDKLGSRGLFLSLSGFCLAAFLLYGFGLLRNKRKLAITTVKDQE
jgi:PPP family 3-phenylpropionic acid transporter